MTERVLDPRYHWSIQTISQTSGSFSGYLVIRNQDQPLEGTPRYGYRLDIPGTHRSHQELTKAGSDLFSKFLRGAVSAPVIEEKEKLRGFRIVGTGRFLVHELKWEPYLELKKLDEPNKGKRQTVGGQGTAFARNLFPAPEGAAKFALDHGKRMVIGMVGGLEI
ncbi:MAG: hypothetical protein IPH39_04180 [Sulfuritalea sp.]|nr:hypothetical protein [Sulfuritalea sp.]